MSNNAMLSIALLVMLPMVWCYSCQTNHTCIFNPISLNFGNIQEAALTTNFALVHVNSTLFVMGDVNHFPKGGKFVASKPMEYQFSSLSLVFALQVHVLDASIFGYTKRIVDDANLFASDHVCAILHNQVAIIWSNATSVVIGEAISVAVARDTIYLVSRSGIIRRAVDWNSLEFANMNVNGAFVNMVYSHPMSSCAYAVTDGSTKMYSWCNIEKEEHLLGRYGDFAAKNEVVLETNKISRVSVSPSHCIVYDATNNTAYGWGIHGKKLRILGYIATKELPAVVRTPIFLFFSITQSSADMTAGSFFSIIPSNIDESYEVQTCGDSSNGRLGHNSKSCNSIPINFEESWRPKVFTFDDKTCITENNRSISCFGRLGTYLIQIPVLSTTELVNLFVGFSLGYVFVFLFIAAHIPLCKLAAVFFVQMSMVITLGYGICYLASTYVLLEVVYSNPNRAALASIGFLAIAIVGAVLFAAGAISVIVMVAAVIHNIRVKKESCSVLVPLATVLLALVYSYGFVNIGLGMTRKHFVRAQYLGYQFAFLVLVKIVACTMLTCLERSRNVQRQQKIRDELLIKLLGDKPVELESASKSITIDAKLYKINFDELSCFEELGNGATGLVLKAKYKKQIVAVKLFRMAIPQDVVEEMFLNELRLLFSLHHSNIVNVQGAIMEFPKIGIVMEYCSKGSLDKLINANRLANWNEKMRILHDVACGMEYLHNKHVIHRDLKCENVLISESGVAKISDFGVSKIGGHSVNNMSFVGTSTYMAPEVTLGQSYNESCDVFSFGILMYVVVFETTRPYGKLANANLEHLVASNANTRPQIPASAGILETEAMEIAKMCWQHEASLRPSFEDVRNRIATLSNK